MQKWPLVLLSFYLLFPCPHPLLKNSTLQEGMLNTRNSPSAGTTSGKIVNFSVSKIWHFAPQNKITRLDHQSRKTRCFLRGTNSSLAANHEQRVCCAVVTHSFGEPKMCLLFFFSSTRHAFQTLEINN